MEKSKYVKPRTAREFYDVTDSTLHRWAEEGKIRCIKKPSGHRLYEIESINAAKCDTTTSDKKSKVCYCRVSSNKQQDDLERQVEYMRFNYPDYEIITDIGSGINWKRSGLRTILERAMSGDLKEVVVAYRDRLCRFAYELIEWILVYNQVRLVVLDEGALSEEEELASDLLSIIHVFNCKQMGRRKYKYKLPSNT